MLCCSCRRKRSVPDRNMSTATRTMPCIRGRTEEPASETWAPKGCACADVCVGWAVAGAAGACQGQQGAHTGCLRARKRACRPRLMRLVSESAAPSPCWRRAASRSSPCTGGAQQAGRQTGGMTLSAHCAGGRPHVATAPLKASCYRNIRPAQPMRHERTCGSSGTPTIWSAIMTTATQLSSTSCLEGRRRRERDNRAVTWQAGGGGGVREILGAAGKPASRAVAAAFAAAAVAAAAAAVAAPAEQQWRQQWRRQTAQEQSAPPGPLG